MFKTVYHVLSNTEHLDLITESYEQAVYEYYQRRKDAPKARVRLLVEKYYDNWSYEASTPDESRQLAL